MPESDAPAARLPMSTGSDAQGSGDPEAGHVHRHVHGHVHGHGHANGHANGHAADGAPGSWDARILEALGEGIFLVDAEWRIRQVNAATERVTGEPRAAMLGRVLWAHFPTLAHSAIADAAHEARAIGAPVAVRGVGVPSVAGGPVVGTFDVRCAPLAADALLLVFREVSRREQERRALAAESAENLRLRQLARSLSAEADAGRLLDELCRAAAALCAASGGTVAEVVSDHARFVAAHGHPPGVLGHRFPLAGTLTGRVHAAHQAAPDTVLLLRAEAAEAEDAAFCPWLADGHRVGPLLLAPLAAHGALLGVLAISRAAGEPAFGDEDEARLRVVADHAALALWSARLVEEARAATRTQNSFLATVSHELRTPLTALTGYGELLADGILGPLTGDQRDVIERMRAVTHQLTAMIEEILTFSALEAGRELVRIAPVAVDDLVRAVRAVIDPLAAARQLDLTVAVEPALPVLRSDGDKLRQILVNLCGNAVKFTARGSVRLSIALADDGLLHCAVADTGVGIARADLARLFQPFTQLDDGLTRRHGGAGLGLYIAQRLARLLGGRVEVVSTPQVGSVFTLVVPTVAPQAGSRGV